MQLRAIFGNKIRETNRNLNTGEQDFNCKGGRNWDLMDELYVACPSAGLPP
jgi:hypothetical protein